jgi:hypothetical protein
MLSIEELKEKYHTQIELIHPIYGKYVVNKFYDLIYVNLKTKEFKKLKNYKLFITNDITKPIGIFSIFSNKFIKCNPNNIYSLSNDGIIDYYYKYNMIIPSIFYETLKDNKDFHKINKLSTDHIDNNHKNDLVNNLLFIEYSENSRKGQEKSIEIINAKGGRNGKKIMLKYLVEDKYVDLKEFQSIGALSKYIILNNLSIEDNSYDLVCSKFGEIISSKHIRISYNKSQFSATHIIEQDLIIDGKKEIWIDIPKNLYEIKSDKKYKISNYGRIKNLSGLIMKPTLVRNKKYNNVSLNKSKYQVHCLVYMSFNPESIEDILNKNKDVCHKDSVPLNKTKDGQLYHRNYLDDLYLESHSQNMYDFHINDKNEIKIIEDCEDELYENSELLDKVLEKFNKEVEYKKELKEKSLNSIEYYMNNLPKYLSLNKPSDIKRNDKYELNRRCLTKTNINLCGSKIDNKLKFIQAIYAYMKFYDINSDEKKIKYDIDELTKELTEEEKTIVNKLCNDLDKKYFT